MARPQRALNIGQACAGGLHHNHEVIQNVCDLMRQALPVAARGLNGGLHRLFPELGGTCGRTTGKQAGRPAFVRAGMPTRSYTQGQIFQYSTQCTSLTAMPAAAMADLASVIVNVPK